MEERRPIPGQWYRHWKGNLYQILTIGKDSETLKEMVVYQALYGDFQVYIRPLEMFLEVLDPGKYPEATQKHRFELVNRNQNQSFYEETSPIKKEVETESREPVCEQRQERKKPEERYLAFFDANTYKEKLELLQLLKEDMDERMLNNIAASMDLPIDDENFEEAFGIIEKNLEQRTRFECSNRFR